MNYLLTTKQMREADAFTIERLGVPSLELMERAGEALFQLAKELSPKGKILLVCGGGNNGGDGYCCGRKLLNAGRTVDAYPFGAKQTEDCQINRAEFEINGGKILKEMPDGGYSLVIDCLFGTGYASRGDEAAESVIKKINVLKKRGTKVLSADIPSGVPGTNGLVKGAAVNADVTLCIGEIKTGAVLGDGLDYCGKLQRADIGICLPDFDLEGNGYAYLVGKREVAEVIPRRKRNTHKGNYGVASIVAGSEKYTGAAYLAARAAARSGAGYTRLYTPSAILPYFLLKTPEILLSPLNDGGMAAFNEEILAAIPGGGLAVGMGLGVSEEVAKLTEYLIQNHSGTLIVDADALTSLAEYSAARLEEIFAGRSCGVILTPHPLEFARLVGVSTAEVLENDLALAEEFAKRHGVTLLLKGASSIVTDGNRTAVTVTGTAGQAKGGSGDVLSGVLAGLAAMKLSPFEAATAGAYLCGCAAEIATKIHGEHSLLASDIVEALGEAFLSVTEYADE
ncbi:MAG: NAD(P)H-hydrate dehydratase [Clostridia bacterium]|nr:NAD(P)H-hydrate dehydratase [Clostridia bacterium]